MNSRIQQFRHALKQKKAVKVIAGIANFDPENVLQIVRAATIARASAVDVAARPDIVSEVRAITDLTVFASCINPRTLAEAVRHGADAVELGNYDALYADGLFFTHDEVLKLARETMELVGGEALVSVTIPGHLSMETQIRMAQALEEMGVDMIQTEGASRALTAEPRIKPLELRQKAAITLSNTRTLARHTSVPLMTASGIDLGNVGDALAAGAAGVGIGSAVNKLADQQQMLERTEQIMLKVASLAMVKEASAPVFQVS